VVAVAGDPEVQRSVEEKIATTILIEPTPPMFIGVASFSTSRNIESWTLIGCTG